jgi:predicted nucleotidyltransferase
MKISREMTIGEFAAMIATYLQSKGISVVLTGGAVVSIYTENKYMSYDADFISSADQKSISKAMQELGFEKHGKDFKH